MHNGTNPTMAQTRTFIALLVTFSAERLMSKIRNETFAITAEAQMSANAIQIIFPLNQPLL